MSCLRFVVCVVMFVVLKVVHVCGLMCLFGIRCVSLFVVCCLFVRC